MSDADASLPLQKAIKAKLTATAAVTTVAIGGVNNTPSPTTPKPYVSFGPFDVLTEDAQEYEGSDTTLQIDGWANGPEDATIKRLGRAIRTALHKAALTLDEDQRLVSLDVETLRYLREPDGITQHVAVSVRARTEPTV